MPLDALYGAGAWERMQACFKPLEGVRVDTEQVDTPDGVRVYARWSSDQGVRGQAKIDCGPKKCHFATLDLDIGLQGKGVTTYLVRHLCDLMEDVGVEWITLMSTDSLSAQIFEKTGAEPHGHGLAYRTAGHKRKAYAKEKGL